MAQLSFSAFLFLRIIAIFNLAKTTLGDN